MKYVLLAIACFWMGYVTCDGFWRTFAKDAVVTAYEEGWNSRLVAAIEGDIREVASR